MIFETVAAAALGLLLVWLALGRSPRRVDWDDGSTDALEETPRGRALLAIKELEFDRETGKINETDFQAFRAQLGREAVRLLDSPAAPMTSGSDAIADIGPPSCRRCGPRPESPARFCSRCGLALAA